MSGWQRVLLGARVYSRGLYLAGLLRVAPLQRVIDRVSRPDRLGLPADCCSSPEAAAVLVEWCVRRATLPFTSRCLVQSLLLFALLHPTVPDLRLVVGVRIEDEDPFSVTGHAWVSIGAQPLLARDRTAFSTFHPVMVVGGSSDAFQPHRSGSVRAVC